MAERQLIPLTDIYIDEMVAIEEASFPTPWSKQAYLQELNSNPIAFYIACVEDSHLLGYAGIWLIADEGHISNVAVRPDCRGQGIGKAMLQALIFYCRQKNLAKVLYSGDGNLCIPVFFHLAFSLKFYMRNKGEL